MRPNRLVAAPSPITSDAGSSDSSSRTSLPRELLEQSGRRVHTASVAIGSLWLFVLLMNNVVSRVLGVEFPAGMGWPWPGNLISAVGVVLSFGMAGLATRLRNRPQLVIDFGLGFEVATAFLIALMTQWQPRFKPDAVSWICVIILVYPAITPATVRKTLLASVAAASMDPLGVGIAYVRGVEFSTSPFGLLWHFAPNYICALLAVIPARIIRGLGRQVTKERELGSYRLGDRLGRGGMGEVYRATHRLLARPAAVKLIRPEVLGDGSSESARVSVERFRREAEAAATLRSAHTIELYDFGVADDGTLYFVMELLDGVDLEKLVARFGPVPAERAIHILSQACDSLAEAHARGLIHRDIKPSNIYTCRLGLTVDFVKVLDFGLVKATRSSERQQAMLTMPEAVTGTPAYLAPEVLSGDGRIDHRVDVYALGCVAYWLLTGRLVFEASSPITMMVRHLQAQPDPPSIHAAHPIPPELDAVVLSCLAKSPDDRPANAQELARRLSACPVREVWTEDRARAWWQTHLADDDRSTLDERQEHEPILTR